MVWVHRFLPRLFLEDLEEQVWSQDVTSRVGYHQKPRCVVEAYAPLQFLSGEGQLYLHASPQVCYRRSSGMPLPGSRIPKALLGKLGTDVILARNKNLLREAKLY